MQQCSHCQYLVPKGYLSCPQCSMPLAAGAVTTHSVYTGKSGGSSRKNQTTIVIGVGLALVALVAMTFVVRGGGDKKFVDSDSLVAPTPDGWRNFSPPDGTFTASFPGVPERTEKPYGSLNQTVVDYGIKQGDFSFGVAVYPAPAYIAPHEAAKRLDELLRPVYESNGGVLEGAAQVLTPRGDQAFDAVVVQGGIRRWTRATTWNGSVISVYAELSADKQPTGAQSESYRRMRDSLHQ
jgi:hypothetical protein